jgi:hypothetical protein
MSLPTIVMNVPNPITSGNSRGLKKMDRDFEMDQIKNAVKHILDHFPKYLDECKLNWPICYHCHVEMCQVIQREKNPFYQCFICMHKEFGI